jgi:hypothetical protein
MIQAEGAFELGWMPPVCVDGAEGGRPQLAQVMMVILRPTPLWSTQRQEITGATHQDRCLQCLIRFLVQLFPHLPYVDVGRQETLDRGLESFFAQHKAWEVITLSANLWVAHADRLGASTYPDDVYISGCDVHVSGSLESVVAQHKAWEVITLSANLWVAHADRLGEV